MTAEQLPGAVSAKLSRAGQALYELVEMEKPVMSRGQVPRDQVNEFLDPARGVFLTVQTHALERLGKAAFWKWLESWEGALSPSDLDLWHRLTDERDAEQHGAGADLIDVAIELARDYGMATANVVIFGTGNALPVRPPSKGGVRFAAYPDRPLSEICREYLALVQRFYQDFQQLKPAPKGS